MEVGQGALLYFERTKSNDNAIEFDDIMKNRTFPRKQIIADEFDKLSDEVDKVVALGIPFNSVIEELRKRNNNYTKKRVK